MTRREGGRLSRTILLGGALLVLTLAGHTAGGGGVDPLGAAVALLISIALASSLARRPLPLPTLAGVLLAGQALLHVVLAVATSHAEHSAIDHSAPPASAMVTAHVLAALAAAIVISRADGIAAAWRRFTASLLGGIDHIVPATTALRPLPSTGVSARGQRLLIHHLVRRGPPVSPLVP